MENCLTENYYHVFLDFDIGCDTLALCTFTLRYLVEAAVQSRVERRLNAWEAIQVEERLNAANC